MSEIENFSATASILTLKLLLGLCVLALATAFYLKSFRGQEIILIRDGNRGSAITLGATILAFSLPLAKTSANSGGLVDVLTWSLFAALMQLALFAVIEVIFSGLTDQVRDEDDIFSALLLGTTRLASAWIFSGLFTG